MKKLLLVLASVIASPVMQGDFNVTGTTACKDLKSKSLKSTGTVDVSGVYSSSYLNATSIEADKVSVKVIKPPTGLLTIEGDISIGSSSTSTSFLQLDWGLVYEEDFELGAKGWSTQERSSCGGDYFLGGACSLSNKETSLQVRLAPHSRLRVKANYHMLDAWLGQTGYLKVDDRVVWSRPGLFGKINACGGESPDAALNLSIDVSVPHTTQSVTLVFGSTLSDNSCEASFGIDDVEVYVQ